MEAGTIYGIRYGSRNRNTYFYMVTMAKGGDNQEAQILWWTL